MTSDEIADRIVITLNAIADPPIAFEAIKPEEIAEIESETTDFVIYVVPKDEREEQILDHAFTCKRTRVVSVAANGPINGTLTLATYLQAMEGLREALEGTEYSRHLWLGNEVVSLWDRETLRIRKRFMALFEATYEHVS